MMMSPRMENAALAYQKAVVLMQCPGRDLFQARGIGVHWKIDVNKVAMPNSPTNVSKIQQIIRNGR